MFLGVNIDHIAVLREARKINDPDPLDAVSLVKRAGADQITIHLREDRRHINDNDARRIIENSQLPVNLECAVDDEIIEKVIRLNPYRATIVPEKREEVTTEGGLDVVKNFKKLQEVTKKLQDNGIEVSLFIDPNPKTVKISNEINADWIELHTGLYSNIYAMLFSNLSGTKHSIKELELPRGRLKTLLDNSLKDLIDNTAYANSLGLKVAAGHGLNYQNVKEICKIDGIVELNIGQCIIARSVFCGFENAVIEMLGIIK
jgi:pyridoxine 5-phosphate synthase